MTTPPTPANHLPPAPDAAGHPEDRSGVLLWALRSPCEAACAYCYFGTLEQHRAHPVEQVGLLSHLSPHDLDAQQVLDFAATIPGSPIGRVVLAGGEPLNWMPVFDLIRLLAEGGVSVTVATNGIPLSRARVREQLLGRVEAVSVSLDSVDAAYNDRLRPFHHPGKGWQQVVDGIRALAEARAGAARPQIGIYSVITTGNLPYLAAMVALAADLGADYYVPQPLSLAADHPLHELCLTSRQEPLLRRQLAEAAALGGRYGVRLPAAPYADQFAAVISTATVTEPACFGGRHLWFAQPDGTVWDCPSALKIAATPVERRRSLLDADAAHLFTPAPGSGACSLMSDDCVAMFPLVRQPALYQGAAT